MSKYLFNFIILLVLSINVLGQKNIDSLSFKESVRGINDKQTLIILGEAHQVAGTCGVESYLINEFVKKGYTTILIEGGISEAVILNEYLDTGDEEGLNYTRAIGENYRELIKGIRELKGSYKELKFKGIDFEQSICLEQLFNKWFRDIENEKLDWLVKKLGSINADMSAKKVKKTILEVKKDYHLYEKELVKELEPNAILLRQIIYNPVFQADYGMSSKHRDKSIVKNLLNIEKEKLKKSILIFGSNHFTYSKHFWSEFSEKIKGNLECALFLFSYKNCTNYVHPKKYSSVKPLSIYCDNLLTKESGIDFKEVRKEETISGDNKLIIVRLINQ